MRDIGNYQGWTENIKTGFQKPVQQGETVGNTADCHTTISWNERLAG
jgi:hypothetical protein